MRTLFAFLKAAVMVAGLVLLLAACAPAANSGGQPTPVTTKVVATTTPEVDCSTYYVQSGDSLITIAGDHGISDWREITNMNPDVKGDMIYAGQALCLPATSTPTATPSWTDISFSVDEAVTLFKGDTIQRFWAERHKTIYANPAYDEYSILSQGPLNFVQDDLLDPFSKKWVSSFGITVTLLYDRGDAYGYRLQSSELWGNYLFNLSELTPTPAP